jgi:iron complex outermembrane receptor protein
MTRVGTALAAVLLPGPLLLAQNAGTARGTVSRAEDGLAVGGAYVTVVGTSLVAVSDAAGRWIMRGVPAGEQMFRFRAVGYEAREQSATVTAGSAVVVDVALVSRPVVLGEIIVEAVSRVPERIVEAPGAVAVLEPAVVREASVTGQAAYALAAAPGVEAVQNGVNDFNVNARGFNSSLSRRVLVLMDGRDLSIPLFGSQEWNALSTPLEDVSQVEIVRGPGSALYGANAFSGVVDIRTPAAREVRGSRLSVAGGELATFKLDARHSGVSRDGRFGARAHVTYTRSDSWSRSRTSFDGSDIVREYAPATDSTVAPLIERRALNGQSIDSTAGGAATGEPDPVVNITGGLRADYYEARGAVATAELGFAQVENEVVVTGIGRMQVTRATRPWARVAWAHPRFHVMAWYSGRSTSDAQHFLGPNVVVNDQSAILHLEGQFNRQFMGERARLVAGGSVRNQRVNTDGTLLAPAFDDRSDYAYAAFGQLDLWVVPKLRAVAAARWDDADLHAAQLSPKAAVVYSPTERQSARLSVNRAFQTPTQLEFFGVGRAGAPLNLASLDSNLRNTSLGPALAAVPPGQLFTTSAAVPVFARGNRSLDVERVVSWELGYKGQFGERLFVTVDAYLSELTNFVTDLLPGVNPSFPAWTAPAEVAEADRAAVEQAVRDSLLARGLVVPAAGLTRQEDGGTAVVVSPTNAGRVVERGVEIAAQLRLGRAVTLGGNLSRLHFEVKSQALADRLLPNSPEYIANLSVGYEGSGPLSARAAARLVGGYPWAAGTLVGYVPAHQTLNLTAAYRVSASLRARVVATNLLDQRRFQIYGGSVNGRRVLGGVTATF